MAGERQVVDGVDVGEVVAGRTELHDRVEVSVVLGELGRRTGRHVAAGRRRRHEVDGQRPHLE